MINVTMRNLNEKAKYIRDRGYIPAVIFGNKLEASIPIELYKTDFKRFLESSSSKEVELNLNGEIKKCVLSDFQYNQFKGEFIHIDFHFVG